MNAPAVGRFLWVPMDFDLDCHACPRLATFLDEVRVRHPDYHARPVPAFGDPAPGLLIAGLAPGLHNANRSGRPFPQPRYTRWPRTQ